MRFIIEDRSTGKKIIAGQPVNQQGRDNLKALIKQASRLGMRGKCLEGLS